jgi:hypothetical protein
MRAEYPKFIKHATGGKLVRVETPEDHKRINPQDFADLQAEIAGDPTHGRGAFSATVTANEERERCALVAETYPRAGKTGALIAAAIRGQLEDLARYPKVLRNPDSRLRSEDGFTVPGPRPDTFVRPDVTVKDPIEESAARTEGYSIVVSQTGGPPQEQPPVGQPPAQKPEFPKVLRDPETFEKPDPVHNQNRDGRFARADVTVQNAAQEAAAIANGYSEVVPSTVPLKA